MVPNILGVTVRRLYVLPLYTLKELPFIIGIIVLARIPGILALRIIFFLLSGLDLNADQTDPLT